jgi:GT2 family glycosyltransferase
MPPTVSVLVLNYNGREHLEACFHALTALDYPREALDLVLVDNGSHDDSLEFTAREFPGVRLQRLDRNYGFAGGYNRGVADSQAELVVLLNNDTHVTPDWLRELVACWQRHQPGCAAVASVMVSWDGQRVEFGGSRINFHGFGFQTAHGRHYQPGGPGPERAIPFGCGGALLIERRLFLDSGGFDEDYFAYYEDVDLGWRTWLLGREVWLAPASVVYHRVHGTRMHPLQMRWRLELNALRNMVKNLEPASFDRAWPAALALAVRRATPGRLPVFRAGGEVPPVAGESLAPLLAIETIGGEWPRLLEKRACVQAMRRRSDAELFARFGPGWLKSAWTEPSYVALHEQLIAAHGLDALIPAELHPDYTEEPADAPPPAPRGGQGWGRRRSRRPGGACPPVRVTTCARAARRTCGRACANTCTGYSSRDRLQTGRASAGAERPAHHDQRLS